MRRWFAEIKTCCKTGWICKLPARILWYFEGDLNDTVLSFTTVLSTLCYRWFERHCVIVLSMINSTLPNILWWNRSFCSIWRLARRRLSYLASLMARVQRVQSVIKLYVLTRPRISGLLVFKIICAFLLKDCPISCHWPFPVTTIAPMNKSTTQVQNPSSN